MPVQPSRTIGNIQVQNFICVADDDFFQDMTIIDEITGQPIDVTDWQFFLDIYQSWQAKADDDDPLITLINDAGFTIVNGPAGRVDMTILNAQTSVIVIPAAQPYNQDIPQNSTVYDFVGVDQNNLQRTRMRGNFIFQQRLSIVP